MKNIGVFAMLMLLSAQLWAECSGFMCSDVTITRMVVRADGDVSIRTSGTESNLSCDATSDYIALEKSATNYNATYSLLLAAHSTKSLINIRTTDSGECKVVYIYSDK